MSPHPDHSALFESARAPRPSKVIMAHLDECASCRERFRRFRAGAVLMSEAGSLTPEVDWARMDDALTLEADSAARSARVGPLRRKSLLTFLSVSGLTLSAAAAAFVLLGAPSRDEGTDEARGGVSLGGPQSSLPVESARNLRPGEPSGLGVTSNLGSRVLASRGEVSAHADALGDGAVLSTGFDGSATVALSGGWQMELRTSSEVEFDHVDDPSVVTLRRGGVSVQPSPNNSRRDLSLNARRWVVSSDGALVARIELNRVRITVLSGHVTARSGAVSSRYTGPIDLSLPDSDSRVEVIARSGATAVASAHNSSPEPPAVAPATPTPASPNPNPNPNPALSEIPSGLPGAEAHQQRSLRAQARTVLSTCMRACREQGTCVGPVTVTVLVGQNGQVTHSRALGEVSSDVRACFEREARTMATIAPASPFQFEFTVEE